MPVPLRRALSWLWLILAAAAFVYCANRLAQYTRASPDEDMVVVLPRFMQVMMTGGDKYLAANLAVMRSLENNFTVKDSYESHLAQARVQVDASWLNPRNEDNYYIAAAFLSWSGHVKAAEEILHRASDTRPFDMLPPFFLGFNYFYYDQNPILGAQWLYTAASRADEQNRYSLSRIAARWLERGKDAKEALRIVRVMRDQAHGSALKRYLDLRMQRLEGLVVLQEAALEYRSRSNSPLTSLEQLVRSGTLKALPADPQGIGYTLDSQGIPQLIQMTPRRPMAPGR